MCWTVCAMRVFAKFVDVQESKTFFQFTCSTECGLQLQGWPGTPQAWGFDGENSSRKRPMRGEEAQKDDECAETTDRILVPRNEALREVLGPFRESADQSWVVKAK